jgi:hypothetical protein
MRLRHQHPTAAGVNFDPQPGHQIPHRRLPDLSGFLLDQPLPNPPRGVPLLPRRRLILYQPLSNKINKLARCRSHPLGHLPRRRCRIRQRHRGEPTFGIYGIIDIEWY